ncbi:MAG: RagB/SusD family nutrient uptake outer membrane protein, partial [Sediminibacterium sp.]
MKKIITSLVLISGIGLLAGCKKFLDQQPLAQVSVNQFYKSKYDVAAAVAGMYGEFQQQMIGDNQYKERLLYWGDYRSDNFERFLSYTNTNTTEVTLNSITPDDEFADWSGLYTVIGRANSNIKYVAGAAQTDNTVTQAVIDKAIAESYTVRAMCYFYIVRVWGAAPVWTEPYENIASDPERERTAADKIITDVIIPDLTKAYSLITKGQTPVVWNVSEGAVCAALADVYMWKKDYANAIVWINNLFKAKSPTGSVYTGTTGAFLQPGATWKNIFTSPATSIESIWDIHWDYTKNGCACMITSWT